MKKLLILSIGLLLFAGCDKEECAVCTVTRTHSANGESTTIHSQSEDELCDEYTFEEYQEDTDVMADIEDAYLVSLADLTNFGTNIETTVTHTISCVYE